MDSAFDLAPDVRAICSTPRAATAAPEASCEPPGGMARRQLAASGDSWVIVFSGTPLTRPGRRRQRSTCSTPIPMSSRRSRATSIATRSRRAAPGAGGYWLITTSSLADYPQQARAFGLWRTKTAASPWKRGCSKPIPAALATVSRQLSYLDYGGPGDRERAGTPATGMQYCSAAPPETTVTRYAGRRPSDARTACRPTHAEATIGDHGSPTSTAATSRGPAASEMWRRRSEIRSLRADDDALER